MDYRAGQRIDVHVFVKYVLEVGLGQRDKLPNKLDQGLTNMNPSLKLNMHFIFPYAEAYLYHIRGRFQGNIFYENMT